MKGNTLHKFQFEILMFQSLTTARTLLDKEPKVSLINLATMKLFEHMFRMSLKVLTYFRNKDVV